MPVDIVESRDSVYRDEVWCDSDVRAVGLVKRMEPEVPVPAQAVKELGEGGDAREERSGDGAQWGEAEVVDCGC